MIHNVKEQIGSFLPALRSKIIAFILLVREYSDWQLDADGCGTMAVYPI